MTEDLLQRIERDLIEDEGWCSKPYPCTKGKLTIGVGHKLHPHEIQEAANGWDSEKIWSVLRQDLHLAVRGCEHIFGRENFEAFSDGRKRALVNMCFQLGTSGLMKFRRMVNAIYAGDWHRAYSEALDSKWARDDTPERAARVAAMLLES